jgi:hypothetical protein
MDIVPAQYGRGKPNLNSVPGEGIPVQESGIPSPPMVCPYCDTGVFDLDEALWNHVQSSHMQQLQGLGLHNRGGITLYRKLLREEAIHKGSVT